MDRLLAILREINDRIDYEKETQLVAKGIFESFDIIMCISECEEEFGIEIPPESIVAENFESMGALWHLISRLLETEEE